MLWAWAIGLTSAAAMSEFYRVKFLTFSLYVYTTISMFIYLSVLPSVCFHACLSVCSPSRLTDSEYYFPDLNSCARDLSA